MLTDTATIDPCELDLLEKRQWFRRLIDNGFNLPASYIVFDCETTGLDPAHDYMVQFAHIVVENGAPREDIEVMLNWPDCPKVDQADLHWHINNIVSIFNKIDRPYLFPYDRLQRDGVDPIRALQLYYQLFKTHQDNGGFFLTHNGINFDTAMVHNHFKRFLGVEFYFNPNQMIDTGLLEKARQCDGFDICPGETAAAYYDRCGGIRRRGVLWSLDKWCIPQYNLDVRNNLDMEKAHTAGFDCYVTHLLLEEFKRLADEAYQ